MSGTNYNLGTWPQSKFAVGDVRAAAHCRGSGILLGSGRSLQSPEPQRTRTARFKFPPAARPWVVRGRMCGLGFVCSAGFTGRTGLPLFRFSMLQ